MSPLKERRLSLQHLFDAFCLAIWFAAGLIVGIVLFVYCSTLANAFHYEAQYDNPIGKTGPKLFCHITTSPSKSLRAWNIWNTWARHCDQVLFGSPRRGIGSLPSHIFRHLRTSKNNQTDWLWTKESLEEMHTNHQGFEWYLKAPDTAFVVVENLKKALESLNSSDAIAFGTLLKNPEYDVNFTAPGPGYVLSSAALDRIVKRLYSSAACSHNNIAAATALGRCMATTDVKLVDATDPKGFRMFPVMAEAVFSKNLPPLLEKSLVQLLKNCSSANFISTSEVNANTQYELYYLTHIVSQ